ncbi:MAG: sigma factor-like helix-turn-helix DNA-binding protein [Nocardioides sp.]|uniref:RNA polymerase sigma factor n=1 Tax=Nocardioides sp. TaxID=35761 RepID=UPI0039E49008
MGLSGPDGCVRTPIPVPPAPSVTAATPVSPTRFPRSQPRQPTFPGPCVVNRHYLRRALGRVPAKQRTALVLRYYLDLDDSRIGELMGCSRATVRSHIHRGLQSLRGAISE